MGKLEKMIINTGAIIMLTPWLIKNSPMLIKGYLKNKKRK